MNVLAGRPATEVPGFVEFWAWGVQIWGFPATVGGVGAENKTLGFWWLRGVGSAS